MLLLDNSAWTRRLRAPIRDRLLRCTRLAVEAQSDLARIGHHRLRPIDVLIAACAHEADGGVLHYDKDYDLLREHTRLRFRSEWLAPAGSLD